MENKNKESNSDKDIENIEELPSTIDNQESDKDESILALNIWNIFDICSIISNIYIYKIWLTITIIIRNQ